MSRADQPSRSAAAGRTALRHLRFAVAAGRCSAQGRFWRPTGAVEQALPGEFQRAAGSSAGRTSASLQAHRAQAALQQSTLPRSRPRVSRQSATPSPISHGSREAGKEPGGRAPPSRFGLRHRADGRHVGHLPARGERQDAGSSSHSPSPRRPTASSCASPATSLHRLCPGKKTAPTVLRLASADAKSAVFENPVNGRAQDAILPPRTDADTYASRSEVMPPARRPADGQKSPSIARVATPLPAKEQRSKKPE